jgi:hypothetical protein
VSGVPEVEPPSPSDVLKYPIAMIGLGLAVIFAVATSRDLGQPLAGILTALGAVSVLGGGALIAAWVVDRRRGDEE